MTTPLYVMHAAAKCHKLGLKKKKFQNFFFEIQVLNDRKVSNDFFIHTIHFVASRSKCVFRKIGAANTHVD